MHAKTAMVVSQTVGSKWCLCISRWLASEKSGLAPKALLEGTSQKAIDYTSLELLNQYEAIS